jgi:dsRNA-specific ribonuclease
MLQDLASGERAGAPHDAALDSHPWPRTVFRRISLDGTSSSGTSDLYADVATMLPPPPPPTLARSEHCYGAALSFPDAAPVDQGVKCYRKADVQDHKLVNSYQQLVQHCEREDILMECCVSETGSASSPTFTAQIMVEGKPKARASSKTKKEAVRVAAQQTLSQLLKVSEMLGFVSFSPSPEKMSRCSFPLEDNATSWWEKNDGAHGMTTQQIEDELVGSSSLMQLLDFYCTRNNLSATFPVTEHGPAHDKTFCCKVLISKIASSTVTEAEQSGEVVGGEHSGDERGGKEMAVAIGKRKRPAMNQATEQAINALQMDDLFKPLTSLNEFTQEYNKLCSLLDFEADAVLLLRHWCARDKQRVYVVRPAVRRSPVFAGYLVYHADENDIHTLVARVSGNVDLSSELLLENEAQNILKLLKIDMMELGQHFLVNRSTPEMLQAYCDSNHIIAHFETQETDKVFSVSVHCNGKDMGVYRSKCRQIAMHTAAADVLRRLQDRAAQEQQLQMLEAQAEQQMQDRAQQQQQQFEQKRLEDQKDALQDHLQKRIYTYISSKNYIHI